MDIPIPSDPFTPILEAAFALHELYESLCKSGFGEQQALYLVGEAMKAAVKGS